MSSHSTLAPRRVPQQPRGQKRVMALLEAASDVLAEKGYEAATMSEIAERAHAAIGSLYQFFPNKESIACALHTHCGEDIEKLWLPLLAQHKHTNLANTLNRLIEVTVDYIDTHPVALALQHAPKSTWNTRIRMRLERRIASFLVAAKRGLSPASAKIYAAICMQLIKSCSEQYLHTEPRKRKQIICEYKMLLRCYADSRFATLHTVQ